MVRFVGYIVVNKDAGSVFGDTILEEWEKVKYLTTTLNERIEYVQENI